MNKVFVSLFLLFTAVAFSQIVQGVVIDSLTQDPVSFANVVLQYKDSGVSCDDEGIFEIDLKNEKGVLLISSVGYVTKKIDLSTVSREGIVVSLQEQPHELDEVVIDFSTLKYTGIKNLGLPKKAKVQMGLSFGTEFCALIKNPYHKGGKLQAVSLALKKNSDFDYLATYNIRFYEYDEAAQEPGRELYGKNLIVQPENRSYVLKVNVDSLGIVFPRNGICIGVEIINTKYQVPLKTMAYMAPYILFTHTPMEILTWNRYRNKQWYTATTKSHVRPDFVNAMIGAEAIFEK
jgi:hypothetical protein